MKRNTLLVIVIALCICLCFALASCGGEEQSENAVASSTTGTTNGGGTSDSGNTGSSIPDENLISQDAEETKQAFQNKGYIFIENPSATLPAFISVRLTATKAIGDKTATYSIYFCIDEQNALEFYNYIYDSQDSGTTLKVIGRVVLIYSVAGGSDNTTDSNGGDDENTDVDRPHTHEYSAWTIIAEPTCTEKGSMRRKCSICSTVETKFNDPLGHTEKIVSGREPTCTEGGMSNGVKCSVCGETLVAQTELAPSHKEEIIKRVEPTCGTKGFTEGKKCSLCGEILLAQEEIPVSGHSYVGDYCNVCGERKPSDGLKFELSSDGKEYTVSKGNCTEADVHIPSSYNGLPVTTIAKDGFANMSTMKTLTIPSSISHMYAGAFYNCTNLTSVVTHASLGDSAFYNCTSLSQVTFGENAVRIGTSAFYGCKSLTSITLGGGIKYVGGGAFSECANLASIKLGKNIKTMGDNAFYRCGSLKEIHVDAVEDWCQISFEMRRIEYEYYNSNPLCFGAKLYINGSIATDIVIPEGTTVIGQYAFIMCKSITSVSLPSTLTEIGIGAFYQCVNLKDVEVAHGVSEIKSHAFYGCSKIKNINIPNSITTIGMCAFLGCNSLESITIPNSVAEMAGLVFDECRLLIIYCEAEKNPGWAGMNWNGTCPVIWDCNNNNVASNGNIYAEIDNTRYALRNGEAKLIVFLGENTEIEIPASVTYNGEEYAVISIETGAFRGCQNITRVTIPESVTTISSDAFRYCSSLTSVEIPSSVTYIGSYAFSDCPIREATIPALACSGIKNSALESVIIISGESISASAFNGCTSLKTVKISDSVTSIEMNAFNGCTNLERLEISNSITSIGSKAFTGCSKLVYNEDDFGCYLGNEENPYVVLVKAKNMLLTSYEINEKTKIIYYGAFWGCSGMTSIEIPSGVASIGESAFYKCSNLASIEIPSSVISIGDSAFSDCRLMTSVIFADGSQLTSIGKLAFENCYGIESIVIPDGVTSIGDSVFSMCRKLKSVKIPSSVTTMGYLFSGCEITEAIIPATLCSQVKNSSLERVVIISGERIDDSAFSGCEKLVSIEIAGSVTSIGASAFKSCQKLNSVTFAEDSQLTSIGESAFLNCTSLTEINIPSSLTSIGNCAFELCRGLTSITISANVVTVGYRVFSYSADFTIYCEAESKPDGWSSNWCDSKNLVVWNYKQGE